MMEIAPLGDSAIIVRLAQNFADAPEQTLNKVLAAKRAIERARIPGVIECASAYTTVTVFFDLVEVMQSGAAAGAVIDWFEEKIGKAIAEPAKRKRTKQDGRILEVPFCCDEEFAFDLAQVASRSGLSEKEVIDLYCAAKYQVSCIGFTPGFPFLIGLPGKLATPRRSTPRKEIAAGSVAIGGEQTGIYPLRSPGGWNVIGRTPLCLFDPAKDPPTLFRAGDRVRFRTITREEFERLKE
jgi:inhibitor of KinA